MASEIPVSYPTRSEVFIVMHHVETESAPEPRSPDGGINVSSTVYVYDSKEKADWHAKQFAEERRLSLGLGEKSVEAGEWRDYSSAFIGFGYQIVVRKPMRDGVEGSWRQRELVWVERQWREG